MEFQYKAKPLTSGSPCLPPEIDREVRLVAFSRLLQQGFGCALADTIEKTRVEPKLVNSSWTARGFIEGRIILIAPSHNDVVSSFEASRTWRSSFKQYYEDSSDLARLRQQDEAYTSTLLEIDEADIFKICSARSAVLNGEAFVCNEDFASGTKLLTEDLRNFKVWEKEYWHKESTTVASIENLNNAEMLQGKNQSKKARKSPLAPDGQERAMQLPAGPPYQHSDTESRRFLGSNLCMGIAAPQAQIGDFICRFWGCDIAAILRWSPTGIFHLVSRADVATAWVPTETHPVFVRQGDHFEGGGVVNLKLSVYALQKLTC